MNAWRPAAAPRRWTSCPAPSTRSRTGTASAKRSPASSRAPRRAGGLEQVAQLLRHPLDLPLVHGGEERQRQRACGDVLAHGELALAMTEALPVEAHQVNRRQVGLALDAPGGELCDDAVALHAAG